MGILKNIVKSYVRNSIVREAKSINRWKTAGELCTKIADEKQINLASIMEIVLERGEVEEMEVLTILKAQRIIGQRDQLLAEVLWNNQEFRRRVQTATKDVLRPVVVALWDGKIIEAIRLMPGMYLDAVNAGIKLGMEDQAAREAEVRAHMGESNKITDLTPVVERLKSSLGASGFHIEEIHMGGKKRD